MIRSDHLSLCYRNGKGIFDISFHVPQGTVTGYLGPNGAGKSTTIRGLLGFMPPSSGSCSIHGMDCFRDAANIKKSLGYIPGEIVFPKGIRCAEFLKFQKELRGLRDDARMKSLMNCFELDGKGDIKRFSKGMKQKLGIITAFMHDPDVLILDEPTSGLDPLMQNEFISLILEEKQRGKTILLSSHIFEEVERTCDQVLIIKDGRLVAGSDVRTLKSAKRKVYLVQTPEAEKLKKLGFPLGNVTDAGVEVYVKGEQTDSFIKKLASLHVTSLEMKHQNLEDIFLDYYGVEGK